MGVTYKLTEEVVRFIINQRQGNPLSSCRQLAESASQKFGLNLSKSSVHDVLKESGIVTPRGRKPKDKFKIPQEKKKQIQTSLSLVNLIPPQMDVEQEKALASPAASPSMSEVTLIADVLEVKESFQEVPKETTVLVQKEENETTAEYEGAGKIFFKAALWDLGIYSDENIKETDWEYFLTYSKGIKIVLENAKEIFIDLPLPIERCIREAADGLVNNVKPLIIHKVSDENSFKSCMEAELGFKIEKILIMDKNDHEMIVFDNIMERKINYIVIDRLFVESSERMVVERAKIIFFSQNVNGINTLDNIINIKGYDVINKSEIVVTLLINDTYSEKDVLEAAADRLNKMYLRDEQDRLVSVKIEFSAPSG